ncbi:MAG: hypothetical protein HY552_04810 [Elusimicrobia bacterium]|nr:hypothetical protein [Elusimicrobiota bacterium]
MKTWMTALTLALAVPALAKPATPGPAQARELRAQIKSAREDLAAKGKARKAALKELKGREQAELAAAKSAGTTRRQRALARRTVVEKYARLRHDLAAQRRSEKKSVEDDMKSKRELMRRLRRGS